MKTVICPYCGRKAMLVSGTEIYKSDRFENYKFYLCKDCNAYVGCHKPQKMNNFEDFHPLGTPANEGLRKLRMKVHNELNPLWKGGLTTRSKAYYLLSVALGIKKYECHIGKFNEDRCGKALKALVFIERKVIRDMGEVDTNG